MLMICWFYCIPFAKFLYFAAGPLLFVYALFMLKRGIRGARPSLRQSAFILMFVALFKMCLFDVRMLKRDFFCTVSKTLYDAFCNKEGMIFADMLGLVVLAASSFGLFYFYREFMNIKQPSFVPPDRENLREWVNITLWSLIIMVVWQIAPWVGYLTVGSVATIFVAVPWQGLAVFNLILLLICFWKVESVKWVRDAGQQNIKNTGNSHLGLTWTPKDTLWMNVFIYLITLALSYVAHDVLAAH